MNVLPLLAADGVDSAQADWRERDEALILERYMSADDVPVAGHVPLPRCRPRDPPKSLRVVGVSLLTEEEL